MSRRPPDFHLWEEVAQSVLPLQKRKNLRSASQHLKQKAATEPRTSLAPQNPSMPVPRKTSSAPPPIADFDRRTAQKLGRGNVEIERRIDLHGTGIEMARVRLLEFLRAAHAEQARMVLVITGKGDSPFARHTLHGRDHFHAPERQGRLRRLVPDWLHDPEFRILVSGFQPAHPKHGGGGAYYVKIRRRRA